MSAQPVTNLETFNCLLTGDREGHIVLLFIDRDDTTIFVMLTVKN
jgi:hypothetical protein